ncbi:ATP-binding cassette domain-containing protein [Staphylococcus epidermidis]
MKINKGEFLGIVGGKGGGKCTLVKVILGVLGIEKGEIIVEGKGFKGNKC